jgi:hypothetical protein
LAASRDEKVMPTVKADIANKHVDLYMQLEELR